MASPSFVIEDSIHIPGWAQNHDLDPVVLFEDIEAEGMWEPRDAAYMKYRSRSLPHDRFTLDTNPLDEDGKPTSYCKYSYPGFQWEAVLRHRHISASPTVSKLHALVEATTDHKFNQTLGTRYRLEGDGIGYHRDKMKDITAETPIVSLSLGDTREFHLRYYRGEKKWTPPDVVVKLEAGDLFILGPRTNQLVEHSIAKLKDEQQPREGKVGCRTSLVFRDIATVLPASHVQRKVLESRRRKQVK